MDIIAKTPKPPYFAVIFTTIRTEEDNGYSEMSEKMFELVSRQDGFLVSNKYTTGLNHKKMKKYISLLLIFTACLFTSCEKVYRDEIFNNKYKIIYGEWRHFETTGGWSGGIISKEDYTIKFTPVGKFSYNNGKMGIITIKEQNENRLLIDFNSLFPNLSLAVIGFHGDDTMSIADTGADMSYRLFVRLAK